MASSLTTLVLLGAFVSVSTVPLATSSLVALPLPSSRVGKVTERFPVRFNRPSRLLAMISELERKSKTPSGVDLFADDVQGFVSLTGTSEKVNKILAILSVLDVKRSQIQAQVEFINELEQSRTKYDVVAENNRTIRLAGPDGPSMEFTPRLNADNTVTVAIGSQDGKAAGAVVRLMKDQPWVLLIGEKGLVRSLVGIEAARFLETPSQVRREELIVSVRVRPL